MLFANNMHHEVGFTGVEPHLFHPDPATKHVEWSEV